jgi:hypothetical protein
MRRTGRFLIPMLIRRTRAYREMRGAATMIRLLGAIGSAAGKVDTFVNRPPGSASGWSLPYRARPSHADGSVRS